MDERSLNPPATPFAARSTRRAAVTRQGGGTPAAAPGVGRGNRATAQGAIPVADGGATPLPPARPDPGGSGLIAHGRRAVRRGICGVAPRRDSR